jgi:RNA polymerase sigma-70 factor (ECF subfamily)
LIGQVSGATVMMIQPQQLRQLLDAHGAALALYARQWCTAPEDALQEALIELLRQDPAPDNPVAWLYKTTRRRAMNWARAEQRRTRHQRRAGSQQPSWFLPNQEIGDVMDVQSLLAALAPLQREIVIARIWGELSLQEIAELVELSTSSVHRHYHAAIVALGTALEGQPGNVRTKHETPTS